MRLLKLVFSVCQIVVLNGIFSPFLIAAEIHEKPDSLINIGLLIADNSSLAATHGAQLAIRQANEKGGLKGIPFRLIVKSMEGPWGTGSKQAVDLIFEDNVWAIMGSHDGRNAHLVEQVITKARLVFLSAWAGDPTLSQAFVPWFFSCVPNNNQQADALTEEIYNKMNISKIAVFSDESYDSKLALNSFIKKSKMAGKREPIQFFYEDSCTDFNNLLDKLIKADANCLLLSGEPSASLKIIRQMSEKQIILPVFGSLSLLDEKELSDKELNGYENVEMISSGHWCRPEGVQFSNEFKKMFGTIPGAVAAYAYDGMNILIETVKAAGDDRENMQKSMSKIVYKGVTGEIRFDDKGNRMGSATLMKIENGIPVMVTEN